MLLGVDAHTSAAQIRGAAELAALLRLELHGQFARDAAVLAIAGLPFARELRAPAGQWRRLDPEGLQADLELAARSAERRFHQLVAPAAALAHFEVLQVGADQVLASQSSGEDIVVLAEPATRFRALTRQSMLLDAAAFASAAAVMLLPERRLAGTGLVLALTAGQDDAAAAVARVLAERLGPGAGAAAVDLRLAAARVVAIPGRQPPRLVVVTRGALPAEQLRTLVRRHGCPVLVIEPLPGEPVVSGEEMAPA